MKFTSSKKKVRHKDYCYVKRFEQFPWIKRYVNAPFNLH